MLKLVQMYTYEGLEENALMHLNMKKIKRKKERKKENREKERKKERRKQTKVERKKKKI